jgi:hypothetical protein
MNKKDKEDNLKKFIEQMGGRKISPSQKELTLDELAKEGATLLVQDTKNPPTTDKKKEDPKNPYVLAHAQVLAKLSPWHQKEILRMEKNKDTNNRHYNEFARKVIEIGDGLSR